MLERILLAVDASEHARKAVPVLRDVLARTPVPVILLPHAA
jgi:nucleotide-binding universal stress UspA family protein